MKIEKFFNKKYIGVQNYKPSCFSRRLYFYGNQGAMIKFLQEKRNK